MLALWIEEGFKEAQKEMQENSKKKKEEKCPCGRAVCCGKHKNGGCTCQRQGREHD